MNNEPFQIPGVSLMERRGTPECMRCEDASRSWDRIGNGIYCPQCIEDILQGVHPYIKAEVEQLRCAICHHLGTVPYTTQPLSLPTQVRIDLCGDHLRALLRRSLGPHAFGILQDKLSVVQIPRGHVFLLHEAFYSNQGEALQPIVDSF